MVAADVDGAITVVHVEIEYGDALNVSVIQRCDGRYGDAVEQTKAHRAVALCVMPRWSYRAEDTSLRAVQYGVHASKNGPSSKLGSAEARRAHPRIWIQWHNAVFRF